MGFPKFDSSEVLGWSGSLSGEEIWLWLDGGCRAGPGAAACVWRWSWCMVLSVLTAVCLCKRRQSAGDFSGMKTGEMLQARHWHKHLAGQLTAVSFTGDTAFQVFARNCPLLPQCSGTGRCQTSQRPLNLLYPVLSGRGLPAAE